MSAVKRLQKHLDLDFPPVKLYLDDLEDIVNTFREVCKGASITTDEYAVENVSELSNVGRVKEITLSSNDASMALFSVRKRHVSLSSWRDTTEIRAAFSRISDLLESRRRWGRFSFLRSSPFYWATVGLVWGFLLFDNLGILNKQWSLSLATAAISLMVFSLYAQFGMGSVIIPKMRRTELSFLERNKDRLLVSLISILLGSVLTFLSQMLWKWIFSS